MATSSAPRPAREAGHRAREEEGSGWVTFAGVMLVVLGTMNIIYGIAAIDDASVYVADAQFVISDLKTWGWLLLITGAVQVLAAFSIWNRTEWGRWIGIGTAGVNSIFQLLWMPAFPFLSLALFAVDILVIYALISYGGRAQRV